MEIAEIRDRLVELFEGRHTEGTTPTVVVWHDPDRNFEDVLDQVELPGVTVLREERDHLFELKRRLNDELADQDVLVWRSRERNLEGDWLADVEARATPFSADAVSMILQDLNAADTRELRDFVRAHNKALAAKNTAKRLKEIAGSYGSARELEAALVAALVGSGAEPEASSIVRALLVADGDSLEKTLKRLKRHAMDGALQRMVGEWTGYTGDLSNTDALGRRLLTGALAAALGADASAEMVAVVTPEQAAMAMDVFRQWVASDKDVDELDDLVDRFSGPGVRGFLEGLPYDALLNVDVLPVVDEVLLNRVFFLVLAGTDDFRAIEHLVQVRQGTAWYGRFEGYYSVLAAIAAMLAWWRDNPGFAEAADAKAVWKRYTETLWKMDGLYRRLIGHVARTSLDYVDAVDDLCRDAVRLMEARYKEEFLVPLDRRWMAAAGKDFESRGYVDGIDRSCHFFLPDGADDRRRCVVVSDALRYEVAQELADRVGRETVWEVDMGAMQAQFPTVTSVNMAALLPHTTFVFAEDGEDGFKVLVDGVQARDRGLRQNVLRESCPSGLCVGYEDYMSRGRDERKGLVGDAKVMYVYHNAIDATGDRAPTENDAFQACDRAVDELFALVKRLGADYPSARITVTADHGFLYTRDPLDPADSVPVSAVVEGSVVGSGRRYVVAEKPVEAPQLQHVSLDHLSGGRLVGLTPHGCVRFAQPGAGGNFVHGGLSLQEVCVPRLTVTARRRGSKGAQEPTAAALELVSPLSVMSNTIVNLKLRQTEAVGPKVRPATYEVYVADASHTPITDVCTVVADRESAEPCDRTFTARLTLRPGAPNEADGCSIVAREAGGDVLVLQPDLKVRTFGAGVDFGF